MRLEIYFRNMNLEGNKISVALSMGQPEMCCNQTFKECVTDS
jgi:hypothetical protein